MALQHSSVQVHLRRMPSPVFLLALRLNGLPFLACEYLDALYLRIDLFEQFDASAHVAAIF